MFKRLRVAVLAGVSVVAAGTALAQNAARDGTALPAAPAGITMQPLGKDQGFDTGKSTAGYLAREQIAFTDPRGKTLYTYKKDPAGKSACVAACAETWRPALAPDYAAPFGAWSVIARPDGTKQWAYQSKPLYTYSKDVDPGSVYGASPARFGGRRKDGAGQWVGGGVRGSGLNNAGKDEPLPADWSVALAYPSEIKVPAGLAVREVPDAFAFAIVDHRGLTLYSFASDPGKDASFASHWRPAPAPQISKGVGDFATLVREDGIRQWTYRGKGLYTYAGDLVPGDAYGWNADKNFAVAAVGTFNVPAGISVGNTMAQGRVLATAQGQTLYRRDAYINQSGGGHSLRNGQPARPAVGRDIGINIMCGGCEEQWRPYLAPKDAKPQGFWTTIARPDGTLQWAYKDYALWTYAGDKKPGDMNGHDHYDTIFNDQKVATKVVDIGTPQDGIPALFWAVALP